MYAGFPTKRDYSKARYERLKAARDANRETDPIAVLTTEELAYLAGLIDGEVAFALGT